MQEYIHYTLENPYTNISLFLPPPSAVHRGDALVQEFPGLYMYKFPSCISIYIYCSYLSIRNCPMKTEGSSVSANREKFTNILPATTRTGPFRKVKKYFIQSCPETLEPLQLLRTFAKRIGFFLHVRKKFAFFTPSLSSV